MTGTKFKYIAALFFTVFVFALQAQDTVDIRSLKPQELKRLGNGAIKQGDYITSIEYYSQYMKLKPGKGKIAYKLAESYRNTRDYVAAQEWYDKAYKLNPANNMAAYYYALMLKMNGNCDKAKLEFAKFKKGSGISTELKKQIKNDIAGCDSAISFTRTISKTSVTHLDSTINKIHVEHSPLMLDSNTLLYSSVRTNKKVYTVTTATDTAVGVYKKFYVAKKNDGKWSYSGEYDAMFNKEGFNSGNGTLSQDHKRFYFTRCKPNKKNKMICAIFVSVKDDKGNWSEPESVGEAINNPKYTATMPTTSIESVKQNEVVYFVSDRPGGKGGLDIWYFIYDFKKKKFSEPKNAGSKVNTTADEITPYYCQDTRSLFFSSNGWAGLGGLDVFKSLGEMKRFNQPENIGAPVNSSSDDLYYIEGIVKEDGFFVSNRKGGAALKKNPTCCDDIYAIKHLEFLHLNIRGLALDEKGNPLMNTKVSLYTKTTDAEPVFIKSVETDAKGNYNFNLRVGNDYRLVFEKDKYLNASHELSTKALTEDKDFNHNATLKEVSEKPFVLTNVHYATDRYELLEPSKKDIDTTLLRFLNENPDVIVEVSSHTDDQASDSYNNTLSQKRADGVLKYLVSKGISAERLQSKGYGETMPVGDNKTEEGRAMNRRTEFKIVGKLQKKEKEYDEREH
ncbi:MAG: OmpA family protein [Bacteroidia bacterium]